MYNPPFSTDEVDCNSCGGNEFLCDRDRCLSQQFKCDGKVDCRDGTDEADCGRLIELKNYISDMEKLISGSIKCDTAKSILQK